MKANTNLELTYSYGTTVIIVASRHTNTYSNNNTVKLLIDAMANVNIRDKFGWSALMNAAFYLNNISNVDTINY